MRRRRRLLFVIGCAALAACGGLFRSVTPGTTSLSPCAAAPGANEPWSIYFPKGRFGGGDDDSDEFVRHWYGKHLAAMKEPSLSCPRATTPPEAYRFLWLRTFHSPWAIRVERTPGGARLYAVQTSGKGGYDPGEPMQALSRELGPDGWNALVDCVHGGADFWHMPLDEKNMGGLDGAEWIVEGLRGGEYRVISRWSPGGSFRDLGWCFVRLAGLESITPVY